MEPDNNVHREPELLDDESFGVELFALRKVIIWGCRKHLGRIPGVEHIAEELAQQTLMKAWQKRKQFRNDCNLSSWVYTIALNTCRDWHRKNNAQKKKSGGEVLSFEALIEAGFDFSLSDPSCDEAECISKLDTAATLSKIHDAKTPRQLVVKLRIVDGLKFHEIAELLQIPLSTVKTRYYAGISLLTKQQTKARPLMTVGTEVLDFRNPAWVFPTNSKIVCLGFFQVSVLNSTFLNRVHFWEFKAIQRPQDLPENTALIFVFSRGNETEDHMRIRMCAKKGQIPVIKSHSNDELGAMLHQALRGANLAIDPDKPVVATAIAQEATPKADPANSVVPANEKTPSFARGELRAWVQARANTSANPLSAEGRRLVQLLWEEHQYEISLAAMMQHLYVLRGVPKSAPSTAKEVPLDREAEVRSNILSRSVVSSLRQLDHEVQAYCDKVRSKINSLVQDIVTLHEDNEKLLQEAARLKTTIQKLEGDAATLKKIRDTIR